MRLLVSLLLFGCISASACLNRYGTNLKGEGDRSRGFREYERMIKFDPASYWVREADSLRATAGRIDASYQTRSDFAVALLHLGRTKEAIEILEPLEKEHPREYGIVANLGTAYELAGRNEEALKLITRGIEINPDSHMGSEWIHQKVLQAKIALAKDPRWLETHSVLGYSFGVDDKPEMPTDLAKKLEISDNGKALYILSEQIRYQLHERLQFVSPPDATTADLLFTVANATALKDVVENAIPFYEAAIRFDGSRPLFQKRLNHMNYLAHSFSISRMANQWLTPDKVLLGGFVLGI